MEHVIQQKKVICMQNIKEVDEWSSPHTGLSVLVDRFYCVLHFPEMFILCLDVEIIENPRMTNNWGFNYTLC